PLTTRRGTRGRGRMLEAYCREKLGPLALRLALGLVCVYHGFDKIMASGGTHWTATLPAGWQLAIAWGPFTAGVAILAGLRCREVPFGKAEGVEGVSDGDPLACRLRYCTFNCLFTFQLGVTVSRCQIPGADAGANAAMEDRSKGCGRPPRAVLPGKAPVGLTW